MGSSPIFTIKTFLGRYVPFINKGATLCDALSPFATRMHPVHFMEWKRAYEVLFDLLMFEKSHDPRLTLVWYCLIEAGAKDLSAHLQSPEVIKAALVPNLTLHEAVIESANGQWMTQLFDAVSGVVQMEVPFAQRVADRCDVPKAVALLEEPMICLNGLATRKAIAEGADAARFHPTNFLLPAVARLQSRVNTRTQEENETRLFGKVVTWCQENVPECAVEA